jgi:hypothetical protein
MPLPMKETTAYVDVFLGIHCTVTGQLASTEREDFIENLGYIMSNQCKRHDQMTGICRVWSENMSRGDHLRDLGGRGILLKRI